MRHFMAAAATIAGVAAAESPSPDLPRRLEQRASAGNAEAVYHLGMLYNNGILGPVARASLAACPAAWKTSLMHERIIGLYEENAAAWDRQRDRDLHERAWLERFAALLPKGGKVLDIGCGMGEPIARWLIGLGFRVTGIDSSPSMIALCRNRFPQATWHVADMRELALGERFDGLIAWHSFFHLRREDQRSMFPLFAAHSKAGSALMFTSGPEHGEAIGEWRGEPLYHASLAPSEYRRLLAGNGYGVVEHKLHDPGGGHSNVWLARAGA